jgi:hypothetical protein
MSNTFLGKGLSFWAVVVIVIAIGANFYGPYIGWMQPYFTQTQPISTTPPAVPVTTQGGVSALLWAQVQDAFNSTDLHSALVFIDIINPSNLGTKISTISYTTAGAASAGYYGPQSGPLDFHVYAQSGANGYFDEWYQCSIPGACFNLRPSDTAPAVGQEATINQVPFGQVSLGTTTNGGTYYVLPIFKLYPSAPNSQLRVNIGNPDGTIAHSTASQGNGYTIGNGGYANNYTAATGSKQVQFSLTLVVNTAQHVWGRPTFVLSSVPPYKMIALYPAVWVAVNSTTNIRASYTLGSGYSSINNQPVSFSVFAQLVSAKDGIGAAYYSASASIGLSVPISIDTSPVASGTVIGMAVYAAGLQNPTDVAAGSFDALPTSYGASSGIGMQALAGTVYQTAATGYDGVANGPSKAVLISEAWTSG